MHRNIMKICDIFFAQPNNVWQVLCFSLTSEDAVFGHICIGLFRKGKRHIFSCVNFCQRFRQIGSAESLDNPLEL